MPFILLRENFLKSLWHGCPAEYDYSFILKIARKWNFYKSLISCLSKNKIVIIKLSLGLSISFVIIENWRLLIYASAAAWWYRLLREEVKNENYPLCEVHEIRRFVFGRLILSLFFTEGKLINDLDTSCLASSYKLFIDI